MTSDKINNFSTQKPSRDNNLNLLRLIAASSVMFSHAYDFNGSSDPFSTFLSYSGGWLAVSLFFTMSGYLIYKSIMKSRNPYRFMAARCLRIFPGLWVMLIAITLVIGVFFTTLSTSDFFASGQTWRYLASEAVIYMPTYYLPGTFTTNPMHGVINGSLWTLRFEFTCYLVTLAAFSAGLYETNRRFMIMSSVIMALYVGYIVYGIAAGRTHTVLYDGNSISKMHRLYFAFFIGVLFARVENRIKIKWPAVAIGIVACMALRGTDAAASALIVAIGLFAFWFAWLGGAVFAWARRLPDISYGVYIYAFPIQQMLVHLAPRWPPLLNASVGLLVTIIPATFSWYLVEKPALKLKPAERRQPV